MDLTPLDIKIRTQHSMCAFAELTEKFAKQCMYGTVDPQLELELHLLRNYIRTLKRNQLDEGNQSCGYLQVLSSADTGSASILVDSVDIMGGALAIDFSASTATGTVLDLIIASEIVNAINAHTSEPNYTAELVNPGAYIKVCAELSEGDAPNGFTFDITGTTGITLNSVQDFADGVDADTYDTICLTNIELEHIFSHIEQITGLCFPHANFAYQEDVEEPTGFILGTSSGVAFVTSNNEFIEAQT